MRTILIIIGAIVLVLLIGYFIFERRGGGSQESQTTLPASVQRLVPPSWTVISNQACDFDDDGQDEWLIVYSYDSAAVQPAGQSADTKVTVHPLGGAIYDAKLESPAEPDSTQYQVTAITPYRLLPDFAIGKGQGYLGESAVQTMYFPPIAKDGKCKSTEVGFLGYSSGNIPGATSLPTRLSLFHWVNKDLGYQGSLFIGNARVDAAIPTEPDKFVTQVTTYNLVNDRSLLCQAMTYERSDVTQAFLVVPGSTTLDFCYGAPPDPTYPDGTVAAELRGNVPRAANDKTKMPPGNTFLLPSASLPAGLTPPVSILALTNTASAAPVAGGGHVCIPEYGQDGQNWWCGQFAAIVSSEVPINGVVREIAWSMISVSQKDVVAEVHWRVSNVELR
jgi:hypothetical protein